MSDTHLFTIFTPTYNRAKLLIDVYECLLSQTFKDFKWLIISDGSTDETTNLVQSWIKENKVDIEYIWQENQGKTYVLRQAFLHCDTKYIVDIDDDDTMTPNCLYTFSKEWENVEKEGLLSIGAIRALTIDKEGNVVGGKNEIIGHTPIDTNYLEMRHTQKGMYENITCWKTDYIKKTDIFRFDEHWLGRRISFVSESVFWSRFARYFNTRYIFVPLRIYSYTPNSIMRGTTNFERRYYNSAYSFLLQLNENNDYFFKNPLSFIKILCAYLIYSNTLRIANYRQSVGLLDNKAFRVVSWILWPWVKLFSLSLRKNL